MKTVPAWDVTAGITQESSGETKGQLRVGSGENRAMTRGEGKARQLGNRGVAMVIDVTAYVSNFSKIFGAQSSPGQFLHGAPDS